MLRFARVNILAGVDISKISSSHSLLIIHNEPTLSPWICPLPSDGLRYPLIYSWTSRLVWEWSSVDCKRGWSRHMGQIKHKEHLKLSDNGVCKYTCKNSKKEIFYCRSFFHVYAELDYTTSCVIKNELVPSSMRNNQRFSHSYYKVCLMWFQQRLLALYRRFYDLNTDSKHANLANLPYQL